LDHFDDYILIGQATELWEGRLTWEGEPAYRPRYWDGNQWVTDIHQAEVFPNRFEVLETIRGFSEEDREIFSTECSKELALQYFEHCMISLRETAI